MAGILVALYVVTLFLVRPVPDRLVALLGGPAGGVDRHGGLRVTYRPPAGADLAALTQVGDGASVQTVTPDGSLLLEFPGMAEAQGSEVLAILGGGGLAMREVREGSYADEIGETEDVAIDLEAWRPDDGGALHEVKYLVASTREALEAAIAGARARGWLPPPGSEIGFERMEATPERPVQWRSYELAPEVMIDGSMIANAAVSFDPNTNRPMVLLDFTEAGAERFCEGTRRIATRKLAILLGDRVRSAPIINGAICGGRASITMGGSYPEQQVNEARAIVGVLLQRAIPPGGTILSSQWHPAAAPRAQEWAARLIFGLLAGLGTWLVTVLVIRVARPIWRTPPMRGAGGFPVRRLLVTLLAPIALLVGGWLTLPGVNAVELAHLTSSGSAGLIGMTLLGVMPILSAFVLVELVALAIPPLRWRRHDTRGRVALGQAVAGLAIGVALVQGFFVATYLESLNGGGADVVATPGVAFRLIVMLSLAAGTMLLAVIAGVIREHGLGNGYAVLLVSSSLIVIGAPIVEDPAAVLNRGDALGAITLLAIVIGTAAVLRWRIAGGEREPVLRVPSSGIPPLSDAGGLVLVFTTGTALGLGDALATPMMWITELRAQTWVLPALVVAAVPLWAWVFARPAVIARVAMQAGLDRPTRGAWGRATLLSGWLLAGVGVLWVMAVRTNAVAGWLAEPIAAILGTAVVLDIICDARAYRDGIVPAGVLHQIQHAGVVERVLADAGIPCHIHASHVRTLFAFFGPWAPAIVMVPASLAEDARTKIEEVTRAARSTLPVATAS